LTLASMTDRVHAGRVEHLQQQQAEPVSHLWQGEGWCQLLTLVGLVASP
jgi:hypothetical protein